MSAWTVASPLVGGAALRDSEQRRGQAPTLHQLVKCSSHPRGPRREYAPLDIIDHVPSTWAMPEDSHPGQDPRYVASDLPCARCGYNLRTLAWEASCPECNTRVDQAVLPPGFLVHSRREAYRLRRGLLLLVVSVLIGTSATIGVTFVMRYWYLLPNTAW